MENTNAEPNQTFEPLTYTAEVRKAILGAAGLRLRFQRTTSWGEGKVEIECYRRTPVIDGTLITHTFTCRAFVGNGCRDALRHVPPKDGFPGWSEYSREGANVYRPGSGVWHIGYIDQPTHERAVFQLLPLGSRLTFHVRLDYTTSPIMAVQGLHGDLLEVVAEKGQHQHHIQLDQTTSRHNSARFGWNSPEFSL